MKKEEAGKGSLIRSISRGVYKSLAIRSSELMARVRNKSWSMVVYEKGIVKEMAI